MEELRTILDIPAYYHTLHNEIASDNLIPLLYSNPLEYMRELFVTNSKLFYNLRDELILRGIGFREEYQNNYLLGREYEIHSILTKTENTNAFERINFAMFGAANFIERFHITSDLFFHNVPWEGLLHFLPGASASYLKKKLQEEGFSIVPVEDYEVISLVYVGVDNMEVNNVKTVNEESPSPVNDSLYDYDKLDLPIEHYFEGNHFIHYCHKNNIEKFSDLTLDIINEYEQHRFTRNKTLNVVKEIYHRTNKKYNPLPYEFEEMLHVLQDNHFKTMCEQIEVDYLAVLDDFYASDNVYDAVFPIEKMEEFVNNIDENYEQIMQDKQNRKQQKEFSYLVNNINSHEKFKYLLSSNIQDLSDLFSISDKCPVDEAFYLYDILDNVNNYSFLVEILKAMNVLMEPNEMILKVSESLKPKEREVIKLREYMTLQEAGENLGITRERVRQIEAKAHRKIMHYRNESKIELYFQFYTEHSKLVHIGDFCDAFHIDDPFGKSIMNIFFNQTNGIQYIESIDRYINNRDYQFITDSLNKIDFTDSVIEFNTLRQIIPGDVAVDFQEVMDMIIKSKGYLRVNDIYVREKISIKDRVNYLFANYITEPLHMDDAGYVYFTDLMTRTFGVPFDSSKRSATTRIAGGDNIILVDQNTFFKLESEKITESFLEQLEKIIDEILSKHPYADPRNIFKEASDLVEAASLYSPLHLYSVIQIYLDGKYETGHGNTLYIYKSDSGVMDAESILLNYLAKNGHDVPFDNVLDDLNWKSIKLDQLIARIDTAIIVQDKRVKTIESFQFTEEEINELIRVTSQQLQKGYVFTEDLAFDLAFNEKLEELVDREKLSDITTLSSIIKWLHKDVVGYSKMPYKTTSTIKSLEQVLAQEFPEIVSRADLFKFVRSKGYSEQKVAMVTEKIVEAELFYPYTATQFINADIIHFDEIVRSSLQEYITNQFGDKSYLSVFSMLGYSQELAPVSAYGWTEWLIYYFADQVGYRKLMVLNSDYRFNKLLLVKADSDLYKLEDLVYYIVQTEYNGREHEEDLAKHLVSKHIIYNPRKLSNEIYNSKFFTFDSFGFFKLRCTE